MRESLTEALMPFTEHLDELRRRLIFGLVGLLPIFCISLFFGEQVLTWMIQPLLAAQAAAGLPPKLITTGALENFNTYLKISFVATLVVGGPWILYQAWRFISPGLYLNERRFVYILAPFSLVMSVAGVVFLFLAMLPIMLAFFVTFGMDIAPRHYDTAPPPQGVVLAQIPVLAADPPAPAVGQMWINSSLKCLRITLSIDAQGKPLIYELPLAQNTTIELNFRVAEYVALLLGMALAFAIAFQMPVVVLLLGWIGVLTPKWLSKYRRHAIFICAVVGAVVTPTGDPLSMMLLTVPLYGLYELGVLLLRVLPASRVGHLGAPPRGTEEQSPPPSAPGAGRPRVPTQAREPDDEP
ncbi:MAG: preprotein translocase subunit TatC [Phycisphaeraceae bacterium]|nr:preprotein translocase subunit TatC [Phycisphaeraceae bacterium]